MSFSKSKCIIRKIYCGDKNSVPKDTRTVKYSRAGTRAECLRRGFGVAEAKYKKDGVSANSLQNIMYVGEIYAKNFKKKRITSLKTLIKRVENMTAVEKKTLLTSCCKKSNNVVDHRAVNSILLYLHEHGVDDLPGCRVVRE